MPEKVTVNRADQVALQVALIREAVQLMREQADAATPGPWTSENEYRPLKGCRCLSCHEDEPYAKAIHDIDGFGEDISPIMAPANADYIANWHPGMARAVANLLQVISWMPSIAHPADLDAAYRVACHYLRRPQ